MCVLCVCVCKFPQDMVTCTLAFWSCLFANELEKLSHSHKSYCIEVLSSLLLLRFHGTLDLQLTSLNSDLYLSPSFHKMICIMGSMLFVTKIICRSNKWTFAVELQLWAELHPQDSLSPFPATLLFLPFHTPWPLLFVPSWDLLPNLANSQTGH